MPAKHSLRVSRLFIITDTGTVLTFLESRTAPGPAVSLEYFVSTVLAALSLSDPEHEEDNSSLRLLRCDLFGEHVHSLVSQCVVRR